MFFGFAFFLLNAFVAYPQGIVGKNIDRDISNNSYFKHYGIGTFDDRDKSAIGSPYIFDDFQDGKVKLKSEDDFYAGEYRVQYDLLNQMFYILKKSNIYGVDGSKIDEIITDHKEGSRIFKIFINEKYEPELLELLVDGTYQLWRGYEVDLIKPTYNAALDVGSVNPEYVREEYFKVSKDSVLTPIPTKRKQIRGMDMQVLAQGLEQGIDENRELLENSVALVQFFILFNQSLVKEE